MKYVMLIINKSVSVKSRSSASAHISSNVTFLSEYPSFQHLRRNELSLNLRGVTIH